MRRPLLLIALVLVAYFAAYITLRASDILRFAPGYLALMAYNSDGTGGGCVSVPPRLTTHGESDLRSLAVSLFRPAGAGELFLKTVGLFRWTTPVALLLLLGAKLTWRAKVGGSLISRVAALALCGESFALVAAMLLEGHSYMRPN